VTQLPLLDDLVASAKSAFGDTLRSIVLFGSAAEGKMRATSDVNLMFVLTAFDADRANAFREPFRFAGAALDVNAMFVLADELPFAARHFAQKFADMKRRHVILHGDDPLAALDISRDALVQRVQQVLLNLSMRLREMYVTRSLREEQCALTLAEAAAPLRTSAAAIVELDGNASPSPKEALAMVLSGAPAPPPARAAESAGEGAGAPPSLADPRFVELLPHLSEARETRALPAGRAAELLFVALDLARALHTRAMQL